MHGDRRQRVQRRPRRRGQIGDRIDRHRMLVAHQRLDRGQRATTADDVAAAIGVGLVEIAVAE